MGIISKNHNSAKRLWNNFLNENPKNKTKKTPSSLYFCDNKKDADQCVKLVVKGIKQATATSLWWYKKNSIPIPRVGDKFIITDWDGNAKAIIETIRVEKVPYNKISPEFAEIEGEGDKSLDYWKKVHEAYYKREMKTHFEEFDENMIIVCEYFKVIFKPKTYEL